MKTSRWTRLAKVAAVCTFAASAGVMAFAPAAFAAPSGSLNPTHGSLNGFSTTVTVSGIDETAGFALTVLECASTAIDNTSCSGFNSNTSHNLTDDGNGTGHASFSYTAKTMSSTTPGNSGGLTCDDTHNCALFVGTDQNNWTGTNHVLLPFTFDPPPPAVAAPTGTPTGPYTLNFSASGTVKQFDPSTNITAKDAANHTETLNTPTVTPNGTPQGSLVCGASNSCTYTSNGATSTAYTDSFTLTFTATSQNNPQPNPPTSSGTAITPYQFTVGARPTVVTSVPGTDESTSPTGSNEAAGTNTITVCDSNGFHVGDVVLVDPGTANSDKVTITNLATIATPAGCAVPPSGHSSGTLTINPAFAHSHTSTVVDQTNASVTQLVQVPLTANGIVMNEPNPGPPNNEPLDVLNNASGTAIGVGEPCSNNTLTGQPIYACGTLTPITITNMRGTDAPWNVTGQVGDFEDAQYSGTGCDVPANFNNHCIPAGNLQWAPVAAVSQTLAPGDTAAITAGPALANPPLDASVNANQVNAALGGTPSPASINGQSATAQGTIGTSVLAGWTSSNTFGVVPAAGLTNGGVTLCSTASGSAGGTFTCGAFLELAVPGSAAATSPYLATVTLTLA